MMDGSAHAQYRDPGNLQARIDLHRRFSTNSHGWMRWIYDQLSLPRSAAVLEVGCGNGDLWHKNVERLPADCRITITDASAEMLASAIGSLRPCPAISAACVADIDDIPFGSGRFDVAVANHVLYHAADPRNALRGIAHLAEVPVLLTGFDGSIRCPMDSLARSFGLDNGRELLRGSFSRVELRTYHDALAVTEAGPLADYILSMSGCGNVVERLAGCRAHVVAYLSDLIASRGSIHITKDAGMFIATGPMK